MGGGSGGGGSNTTVTKQELPAYAQPYAEQLLSRGTNLSQQPYQPYSGQRIADMSPETQAGLQMTRDRALAGNPAANASTDMLAKTAAGEYMNPNTNPYFGTYMNEVQGRVNNQFSKPSAYGGSAHQELLTRNLGDAAGQFYNAERANQMRAAALAPQMAQLDYTDAQQLLGVGDVYGQRQQDLLNLQYENWLGATNYPYQQLDVLANTLAGSTGGRSTTISQGAPIQYNRAANALGGGLLGYGMGSMMPASALGGYAPYLGAGAGLLGGLAL